MNGIDRATNAAGIHGNSSYSEEIAIEVCEAIATSTIGLRRLCAERPDLPAWQTVMGWRHRYPEFEEQYARAKQFQMELMAEEIIELADDPSTDSGQVQRSKLQVEARKWLMSKLAPRKFGEKIDVTSHGEKMPIPSHQIDARVQSIVMQAAMRLQAKREQSCTADGLRLLE